MNKQRLRYTKVGDIFVHTYYFEIIQMDAGAIAEMSVVSDMGLQWLGNWPASTDADAGMLRDSCLKVSFGRTNID